MPPSATDIDSAIEELLHSRTFNRSEQLRRLLEYLRESLAANDDSSFTELAIAERLFGRNNFDPRFEAVVRTQMLRLRKKLEEYYAGEGASAVQRVTFERYSYRPMLTSNMPPSVQVQNATHEQTAAPASLRHPGLPFGQAFSIGMIAGLMAGALTCFLVLRSVHKDRGRTSEEVSNHPLWRDFRNSPVDVAFSTPLFFLQAHGYERDLRLNLPEDLAAAPQFLSHWPALPLWDQWASFSDVGAASRLDVFLRDVNSSARVVPARQVSNGSLAGKRLIVLGHPRGAPVLYELLKDLDFRPPPQVPGHPLGGFVNATAGPTERTSYEPIEDPSDVGRWDQSSPDFALVSSIRLKEGGVVMSVFGNRVQTASLVVEKLLDPGFLLQLEHKAPFSADYRSFQIVFRVDYNKATPIGAVYVMHKVRR